MLSSRIIKANLTEATVLKNYLEAAHRKSHCVQFFEDFSNGMSCFEHFIMVVLARF